MLQKREQEDVLMSAPIRIPRYNRTAGPSARLAVAGLLVGVGLASCSPSSSDAGASSSSGSSGSSGTSGALAIKSFTASTDWVVAGTEVMLSWDVTGATKITLDGVPVVEASKAVSPTTTTAYQLLAWQGTNPTAVGASVTVYAGGPLTSADLGLGYKNGSPAFVMEEGASEGEYFTVQLTVASDTGLVGMTAFQSHAATTWSCTKGAMAGNKVSFPDGCNVRDGAHGACSATVTPFVLRLFSYPSSPRAGILWPAYSFTWSGASCASAGQTEHMDSTMALAAK
jgi:hypothetical protein